MTAPFRIYRIVILGFGFFGLTMIWTMYNMYVPVFLKDTFKLPFSVVGSIMTIDNVFAVLLLPFLGALSDRTSTPLGRRRPYILIGAPLALVFFIAIPFLTLFEKLSLLISAVFLMNFAMAFFRTPVIALMPDITPSPKRSLANGIINLMGGAGGLLVFFGGKPLYDRDIRLPFIVFGVLMFAGILAVVFFIRENQYRIPDDYDLDESEKKFSLKSSIRELRDNLKDLFRGDKKLLFVLLAIFFWFTGYNAIETFFSSYVKQYLGMKESTGGLILGGYSLVFMLTAVFSGMIGQKIGRSSVIKAGLIGLLTALFAASFLHTFLSLMIVFGIAGFCWSLVNVNSLPMVVDMTEQSRVGGYTGLYYLFSQLASIVSPPAGGWLLDRFTRNGEIKSGYPVIFYYAVILIGISVILMVLSGRKKTLSKPGDKDH